MKVSKKNSIKFKPGSTVFFVRIQLRHSGNSIYKVYVSYFVSGNEAVTKNDTLINGWYCTCKNGTRTVGCCSHISSIIYYFGYARYLEHIPKPAAFLSDIFPNVFRESTDDEIDEPTQGTQNKRKKNSQKKSKSKIFSSDSDKSILDSEKENEDTSSLPIANEKLNSYSPRLNSEPHLMNSDFLEYDLNNFKKHVPSWGGRFVNSEGLTRIRFINTCTIDYFLLGLWYATKIKIWFKTRLELINLNIKNLVLLIVDLIDKNEWNKAKSIWIVDVLKKTTNENGVYDLFGDQTEVADIFLQTQQTYESFLNCSCGRNHSFGGEIISFVKNGAEVSFSIKKIKCNRCKIITFVNTKFLLQESGPLFLII